MRNGNNVMEYHFSMKLKIASDKKRRTNMVKWSFLISICLHYYSTACGPACVSVNVYRDDLVTFFFGAKKRAPRCSRSKKKKK